MASIKQFSDPQAKRKKSQPVPTVQRKMKVGNPNDKSEQEANNVADRVMLMPENEEKESANMQPQNEEEKVSKINRQAEAEEKESSMINMQPVEKEENAVSMKPEEEEKLSLKKMDDVAHKDENEKQDTERKILDENEDSVTVAQKVTSEEVKSDHITHSVKKETDPGNNGSLSEEIKEKHTVYKDGTKFKVTIDELDIHTTVNIHSSSDPRWDKIEQFTPYYNTPYNRAFNLYNGSLKHENQHAKETVDAFNKFEAGFRTQVATISENTKVAAEAKYVVFFNAFDTAHNTEYWASGEALAEAVEWDYYHVEFEKFAADPISYSGWDWKIFDSEALKVLKILKQLKAVSKPTFDRMVNALKTKGVINNLLDNIADADKVTYKDVIADIYLLL